MGNTIGIVAPQLQTKELTNSLVCIDSNCLTYLVDAMALGGRPTGNEAEEKIALLRIYFYRNDTLYVSPTVKAEYEKMTNKVKRQNHRGIADILLGDIQSLDPHVLESQALEYAKYHNGERNKIDCRILAETELGGGNILLTYDKDFLRRLRNRTHSIRMLMPSEFWSGLSYTKGIKPVTSPHPTSPLAAEAWWAWQ